MPVKIFPNPARNDVSVIVNSQSGEGLVLVIFSMSGLKAGEYIVIPGEQTLSLANFRAGMYYAMLYQDGKMVGFQKIMKY